MEIKGSDFSKQVIPDGEAVEAYIHGHDKSEVPVKLDLTREEAGELGKLGMKFVTIEVVDPSKPDEPAELIMTDQKALDKFGGTKFKVPEVIAKAEKVPKRKLARAVVADALNGTSGEKDYRSLDHCGEPKKGVTSPQEQRMVQENFDEVNARLEKDGLRAIDLSNKAHVARYGLEGLAAERGITPQ